MKPKPTSTTGAKELAFEMTGEWKYHLIDPTLEYSKYQNTPSVPSDLGRQYKNVQQELYMRNGWMEATHMHNYTRFNLRMTNRFWEADAMYNRKWSYG